MSAPNELLTQIAEIRERALSAISAVGDSGALETIRVRELGRKAALPQLLRHVAELAPAARGQVGAAANAARNEIETALAGRATALQSVELDARLAADRVDLTLPGAPALAVGRLNLLTITAREIEDIFVGLGYRIAEGPDVETVYYNFDALNTLPTHPSRQWSDTFYVSDEVVLRTHTSPVQVRAMESSPPPLYVICPGRTFRRDSDATHTPQFHQMEGLAVDEEITLGDLQGTLLAFAQAMFGDERRVQLRPHFFPFTEPSVEVDVSCFQCVDGYLADGSRCNICRGEGWLEILGAGIVDPNVFEAVREHGYDPERIQGFAFGMGIERIGMLKHGLLDLRLFYENDVRILEQFS